MFAARGEGALPKGISKAMLALHERHPFTTTPDEIAELARAVRDPNFRVMIAEDGIHAFNRSGHHLATDPFALWPQLGLEDDAAHAFYMGVELARAQIAWQLGKRYAQDEALRWGVAAPAPDEDLSTQRAPGTTLTHGRHRRSGSSGE
jgi:hypothetical protein